MRFMIFFLVILFALVISACSGSGSVDPITNPNPEQETSLSDNRGQSSGSNRYMLGLWDIQVSADHTNFEITPLRDVEMHLNVTKVLEISNWKNFLEIENIYKSGNEIFGKLILNHPYPKNLKMSAFDVRAIFISTADYTFPESGRSITWTGDTPRLLQARGYTSLFNPTEFPEDSALPSILKYFTGEYATSDGLTSTLNPYLSFLDFDQRNYFQPKKESSWFRLKVPDGPFGFGYAVDANWVPVDGEIVNPVEDFPEEANCREAYFIEVRTGFEITEEPGSSALIEVKVYDHQGLDTIESVTVEAPDFFAGTIELYYVDGDIENGFNYSGTIMNELGTGYGEYPVLVRVVDTETDVNLGVVDCWQVTNVNIHDGWVRTLSHSRDEMAMSDTGEFFIPSGIFGSTDLDPGSGYDIYESSGSSDAALIKLDADGYYLSGLSWGGLSSDSCDLVALDSSGGILLTGQIDGYADLDPGPEVDEHGVEEGKSTYLSKLNASGEYQWGYAWPYNLPLDSGNYYPIDSVIANGSDDVYIVGDFRSSRDLDPGPGEDLVISDGRGIFASKFNSDGNYIWGIKLEEDNFPIHWHVGDIACDSEGNLYIDLMNSASSLYSCYLIKVSINGDIDWTQSWLSEEWLSIGEFKIDPSDNLYICGSYAGEVDFDPGPDVDLHTSIWHECGLYFSWDMFTTRLDTSGNHAWTTTWGTPTTDKLHGIDFESDGKILMVGVYNSRRIGFNWVVGVYVWEVYIARLDQDGSLTWSTSWTDFDSALPTAVFSGLSDDIYIAGELNGSADFDPGDGIEEHSWYEGGTFLMNLNSDGTW